ncbi:MAG: nucleotide exchange factor GrpE [Terriglobales bacterium]
MTRTNGQSEVKSQGLDAEHELPASDETQDDLPARVDASGTGLSGDNAELQKLKAERKMLLDRLARMQAEFDNARKRATREQQDYRDYALADALKGMLPTLDSLERALQVGSTEKSELRNGVELIHKQLLDALSKLGLRPIQAKGELFDPHLHEAIEMVETTVAKDHQVLEELQRGYKLKDRLLRPAMVRVARNS